MRCMRCGAELRPDAKFCGVCGQVLGQGMGSQATGSQPAVGQPYSQQTGSQPMVGQTYGQQTGRHQMGGQSMGGYPQNGTVSILKDAIKTAGRNAIERVRDENRMQGGLIFGSDEQIIRHYQIGRYTLRKGTIELIVTNKRVIRYEESSLFGMRNNFLDEVDIQSIQGVSAMMRRSVSILGLTIGLAFLIFGLVTLFNKDPYSRGGLFGLGILPSLAALLIALIILVKSFKPTLAFYVRGGGEGTGLETVVNARGRIFGRHNIGVVFQFKPTAEVAPMLKEIGALIYDIRTLGDAGIARWM